MSRTIQLTQGQIALVDDDDYERLSAFKWYADKRPHTFYAARNSRKSEGRKRVIHMHTQIIDANIIDHCDRNGLNNQRANLRAATTGQNSMNSKKRRDSETSKYKGVYWNQGNSKWMVRLAGKYLGYFDDEIQAARAYNAEALIRYGEFAELNVFGEKCI